MSSFDFGYTCPSIDKDIEYIKYTLVDCVESFIDELCPLMPSSYQKELSEVHGKVFYEQIEDYVENIRKTNEEMREAATTQIDSMTEDYKEQIEVLKEEISSLEKQIDEHEDQI